MSHPGSFGKILSSERAGVLGSVRRVCLGFRFRLAVLAECHLDASFVGAAQDGQLNRLAGRPEGAGCQAGTRGRAVFGDPADEQALGVGETHGAAQSPGHVAGSDRDAELRRPDGFPAGQCVDPAAQRLVGGYGQVEALAEAVRVDPEQLPLRVEDRTARGAGQQWGGVLQAAGDAQAARAAEAPVVAGDGPERHPQSAPARVGQGEHGCPDGGYRGGPRQRGRLAGVGLDDGEVAVDVAAGHGPLGGTPVGEGDRRLAAAHVVRVGQHPRLAEHDARADAPPLPDAGYRGAGVLRQPRDAGLNLVEDRHYRPFLPVSSNLQVTTNYADVNAAATISLWPRAKSPPHPWPKRWPGWVTGGPCWWWRRCSPGRAGSANCWTRSPVSRRTSCPSASSGSNAKRCWSPGRTPSGRPAPPTSSPPRARNSR